ncbi:MAG: hypothetical protein PHW02_04180 [bacterium]|nr:hypothetical protein [bacterium]
MEKIDLYLKLKRHLLNDNREELDAIYLFIIKNNWVDYDTLVEMMKYMYKARQSSRYLNLLRLFGSAAKSDAEISYFVAFYFLMNKSFYHALIAFKLVNELDGGLYFNLAKSNIKVIEQNELKLLNAIKSQNLDKSERLKTIEANIYDAVYHMIDYAKSKDTFRGSDDKSRFI